MAATEVHVSDYTNSRGELSKLEGVKKTLYETKADRL
jgi:hypothetical protein